MTRTLLFRLLHALDLPADPSGQVPIAALEARADADPRDMAVRDAFMAAHGFLTAEQGLGPVVAGVLRERLVRWDAWSTTWVGSHALTGGRTQVRVLRPWAARDPMQRRMLARDARALQGIIEGVRLEADGGAIVAPLPGPEAQPVPHGGHVGADALVALVVRSIGHLTRWEQAGLGLDELAPGELCDAGDRLVAVTLTPQPPADAAPILRLVAGHVRAWWSEATDHPLADLLAGFAELPPRTVAEAAETCRAALASVLADTRHGVLRRDRSLRQRDERARLTLAIQRLAAAVDPPRGRAAVGVGLDGKTLVVQNYDRVVLWGAVGERPEVIWSESDGLDPQLARRLLRVRGSAPVSERLNREVEGNPVYVDRIARWTAGQLELRTLRLLLLPHS